MVAYFDTSAFVPLLLREPGASGCQRVWNESDLVFTTRLLYVESVSALRRANRQGRLPDHGVGPAMGLLLRMWSELRMVEIDSGLTEGAGIMAWRFGLRGYDAVHCAAAHLLHGHSPGARKGNHTVVAASGDRQLLSAWRELGVATFEPGPAGTAA